MDLDEWILQHLQKTEIIEELAALGRDERWKRMVDLMMRERRDLGAALDRPELFLGTRAPTHQEHLMWALVQRDSAVQKELAGLQTWYATSKAAVLRKFGWTGEIV